MIQPFQYLGGRVDSQPVRPRWPINHDDRQGQIAGGVQLGAGTFATGVFGDDDFNVVEDHKVAVGRESERPSGDNRCDILKGQFAGLVDEAQQVMMLRLGGERVEILATDGEENLGRRVGQGGDGGGDVGNVRPIVAVNRRPGRAVQGDERGFRGLTGGDGVVGHRGGKRVGCVDNMRDFSGLQVGDQAFDAAKPAGALGQGLRGGGVGAASVGIGGVDLGIVQGLCQQVRLGRATKQKDAHFG